MNAPVETFTNGRWELPRHARGVLVLADPPEAGWQIRTRSNQRATFEAELLAAPACPRYSDEEALTPIPR